MDDAISAIHLYDSSNLSSSEDEASFTVTVKNSSAWEEVRYDIWEFVKLDICKYKEKIASSWKVLKRRALSCTCVYVLWNVHIIKVRLGKGEDGFLKIIGELELPEPCLEGVVRRRSWEGRLVGTYLKSAYEPRCLPHWSLSHPKKLRTLQPKCKIHYPQTIMSCFVCCSR